MKTCILNYLPTSANQVRREEGAVLVVALVLLIVLTMLGISAIESTKLETRMAANTTNYNQAFQVAELRLSRALTITRDFDEAKKIIEESGGSGVPSTPAVEIRLSCTPSNPSDSNQIIFVSAKGEVNSIQTTVGAGMSIPVPSGKNLIDDPRCDD